MTYNILLENLIDDLGGCGLYQWLLASIVHVGKTIATWSMITMTFAGQDPGFLCSNGRSNNETYADFYNESRIDKCSVNDSSCSDYVFKDDMRTVVSEVELM